MIGVRIYARRWMKPEIAGLAALLLAWAWPAAAQNTLTLENRSGEPALVKLIGPSGTMVRVPTGAKLDLDVAGGRYLIKVRYGRPGAYRYTLGDDFRVLETPTARSETVIRLQPGGAGSYRARGISKEAFDDDAFGQDGWRQSVLQGEATYSGWVEIVRDPDLQRVWTAAESAYRMAVAQGSIPVGRNNDLIGFADLLRDHVDGAWRRDTAVERFGAPRGVRNEAGMTWLDYGPIQLGLPEGSDRITTLRAMRGLYTRGFVATAEQAVRNVVHGEAP